MNPVSSIAQCRVCGSAPDSHLRAYGADYDRCGRCGTLQKRLTKAEFLALDVTYDPGVYFDGNDEAEIANRLEVPAKEADLRKYAGGRTGRFLDIGCGMGGYLLAARSMGYEILGFEPSENHARVATELLGLPVVGDYFSPDKVAGQRFDLIMLSHVIEHIYDPKAFLAEIRSVLAPGGILLIVTPNVDSLVARAMGSWWPMLVPADHVTLLGPRSLGWLFDEGVRYDWSTSEYGHEFASNWAAAFSRRASGKGAAQETSNAGAKPPVMRRRTLRTQILKAALTIASLPFHLAAKGAGRQGCLVVRVAEGAAGEAANVASAGRGERS
jgi:SAM-dependent methyltransferase